MGSPYQERNIIKYRDARVSTHSIEMFSTNRLTWKKNSGKLRMCQDNVPVQGLCEDPFPYFRG
jgi:hypothetical protein